MVYIFSESPLDISDSSIQLVDTKIIFRKPITLSKEIPSDIATYSGEMKETLLTLSIESGVYSRYKLDLRLRQEEFEKLYKIWIQKAWESKSILEAPDMQGMVTYSVEGKSAKIGLIAVSKESQGKGWGKKLMKAAEAKASTLGAKSIEVSTQEANTRACRLYESLGYKLAEKVYIYHWWKS